MNKRKLAPIVVGVATLLGLSANANAELKISVTKSVFTPHTQERIELPKSDSKVIPYDEYIKQQEAQKAEQQAALSAEVQKYERSVLIHNYSPRTNHQILLPLDIADIHVKKVKGIGYETNFDLSGKKDKLSVYLSQNKHALHLLGLYKQRILAWNNGVPPSGTTVQNAIDQEALFKFLEIELTSTTTTPEMLTYFEKRLGSKEIDILRNWVSANSDEGVTKSVVDILSESLATSKARTYPYNP